MFLFSSLVYSGQYCDVVNGALAEDGLSCTGKTITVGSDGKAAIQFSKGNTSALAFHHLSKIGAVGEYGSQ